MNKEAVIDTLWIASEICYYLGLVLAVFLIPALTFMLWMMSLAGKVNPNYWYILLAWGLSVLIFLIGVGLKNLVYSAKNDQKES